MVMSRRLAFASAAFIIGLSACGSAASTTGQSTAGTTVITSTSADAPEVIHFGPGAAPSAAGTATDVVSPESADSKMMALQSMTYVFDGEVPALSSTGASWRFPVGFSPDRERVAAMAAALGVTGEVRELPADQGGGFMVGADDYSTATLTVSGDGLGSWWFNPSPATGQTSEMPVVCMTAVDGTVGPAADPAAEPTVDSTADATADSTAASFVEPAGSIEEPKPTEPPQCDTPAPPANVPDEAASLDAAKALLTSLGYDTGKYEYEYYGDEWSSNVTAYLVLDGMRSPLSLSVGFGGDGAVLWSSGSLAEPERDADYSLISTQAGVDRLNDQQLRWLGIGGGYAGAALRTEVATVTQTATAAAPAAEAPPTEPNVASSGAASGMPSSDVMPVPCDGGAAVDCGPIDMTPITVHLNSVKPDLTMIWDADNTVWLLPAYTYGTADGGMYTVLAVADEYIDIPVADPVPVPQPAPDTIPTDTVVVDPTGPTTPVDGTAVDVDTASKLLVGLSETDAEAAAIAQGWTLRVVERDGQGQSVTDDYRTDRVNVVITDGVVTAVQSIS